VPIYDYVCASCRQKTEVIHGIDAPGPRFCPVCGAEGTMRKSFAMPTVHFKGSGWAKKDRSISRGARSPTGSGGDSGDTGDGASKAGDGGSKAGETSATTTSSDAADKAKPTKSTGSTAASDEG
jgi:putative FmdB family regulatory protein